MLEVEFFIAGISSVVGLGVAPAVEKIATVAVPASFVACCFFRCRAMVENPDLVEVMGADEDLVELGVVVYGGEIRPALAPVLVEVDIGEFRMLAHIAVIALEGVEILDEVVPDVPFPDDVATRRSGLVDLDEHVRVELVAGGVGVASCHNGLEV